MLRIKSSTLMLSHSTHSLSSFSSILTTFRCWMTKMFAGDFGQVIIKALQEWNHLFAPCLWDWMMAGTRSSSICQTSPEGPMEPITSRRCAYRLAESADSGRHYWLDGRTERPRHISLALIWPFLPSDPRKLSNKTSVLLRQTVFRGWASGRI